MAEIKLKKFQIVMVDEKRTFVKYEGVENKSSRPFLVVKADHYGSFFTACPLTDAQTAKKYPKLAKKSYLLVNVLDEESYLKTNFPITFPKSYIDDGIIVPIDRHLNKSQRKIAIKLLQESFLD